MSAAPRGAAPGVESRAAAWQALRRVHAAGAWASAAVDRALRRSRLDERDRRFAANLAFSTLRWEGTLDWALGHVVDRPLDAVEPDVRDVLRLGAYEILHATTPERAAVAAAVDTVRRCVGARPTGFVNGVLRALARGRDTLPWPPETTAEGLGLALGYPTWVVQEARTAFGERARAVLEAGNRPAPTTLRAVAPREQVLAALAATGIAAQPGRHTPEAVLLSGSVGRPADLAVVSAGRAVVQDEASMVVAHAAAAGQPAGTRAVDLCAAPGGKATHLAQLGLDVLACDRHAGRLRQVRRLADRTGLPLRSVVADAALPPLRPGSVPVVLLDAPCTGLGVVRRRPELRWRRRHQDVAALAAVQRRLLTSALALARPGGQVVYAVCTWTVAETAEVVDAHRARLREQRLLLPDTDGTDGMFLAVLEAA